MTVGSFFDKKRLQLDNVIRSPVEKVDAVFDDELWTILGDVGLLTALDRGELRCFYTQEPLAPVKT